MLVFLKLIIDFLNAIRKLRHILYCNVRVLLWHVLFHTSHTTLFGKHFMSYVRQLGPIGHCCRDRLVVGFPTTCANMKCLPNRVVWLVWKSTCHNKTRTLQYNICLNFLIALRKSKINRAIRWSIGSWISDYMFKQCLSPLTLWAWIPLMARCTRYNFLWYICFSELRQDDSLLRHSISLY
jgi:hypothetical protein